jgi:hypothetical protein
MASIVHGNVKFPVEQFEFYSRMYGGSILVSYVRNNDRSIDWEPELLRVVDVTDGEADWEDDDVCLTVDYKTELAQAVFSELDDYITDCCRDDCRWD